MAIGKRSPTRRTRGKEMVSLNVAMFAELKKIAEATEKADKKAKKPSPLDKLAQAEMAEGLYERTGCDLAKTKPQ